jgi:hypothetical protein
VVLPHGHASGGGSDRAEDLYRPVMVVRGATRRTAGTIRPMAAIPTTAKTVLQQRVAAHHAQHWPQLSSLDIRWRGAYAYLDAVTDDGAIWQLCRLQWNGHHDHWGFAIYLYSRDGYEANFLPTGLPTGTPEDAIDCAALLYLNDWTEEPPKE